MDEATVLRFSGPAPRYTSYPTAPHFKPSVGPAEARQWLSELPDRARLSLYLHIPFCTELCWYCACTTKASRRYEPVAAYVETLLTEIETVGQLLPKGAEAGHIHWGGGSPSMLQPADIHRILEALRARVTFAADVEHAMEIDPRQATDALLDALAAEGFNRISLGVQDFDVSVQAAINRYQSLEETKAVVDGFRRRGITAINIDLVYGLPHQTDESVARTIDSVLLLKPSRLAVFGYAHVPAKARPQRLIDTKVLPGPRERMRQSALINEHITKAGYVAVGIDHFALPDDSMARASVRRNFQGYTTDASDILIGLGASAISKLPQGYLQNHPATPEYKRLVEAGGLATARGLAFSADDRVRAAVIERLMCDFTFCRTDLLAQFGAAAKPVVIEAEKLLTGDAKELVERTPDGFRCTAQGRTFVRWLCTRFDAYWGQGSATHALAV